MSGKKRKKNKSKKEEEMKEGEEVKEGEMKEEEKQKIKDFINEEEKIKDDYKVDEEDEEEEEEEDEEEILSQKIKNDHEKKCSLYEHKEIDAIIFCQECQIYMCNKCEKTHLGLCKQHHIYKLDNNFNNIFTGFCREKNHYKYEYEYFCKNHNQLCCVACIAKIKGKGKGNHKDCDVCFIKKIRNKKKSKLEENLKYLEELSKNIEQLINELKILFEKINENKEKLKLDIQKIFTKIRNSLNDREDALLFEVDKQFDKLFFKEELIKETEKLPNKIKISLEKGKISEDDWKDKNKLNSIINDCINIENNIKEINKVNENVKKCNSLSNLEIIFNPEEKEINNVLETIKIFGKIDCSNRKSVILDNNMKEKGINISHNIGWTSAKELNPNFYPNIGWSSAKI